MFSITIFCNYGCCDTIIRATTRIADQDQDHHAETTSTKLLHGYRNVFISWSKSYSYKLLLNAYPFPAGVYGRKSLHGNPMFDQSVEVCINDISLP